MSPILNLTQEQRSSWESSSRWSWAGAWASPWSGRCWGGTSRRMERCGLPDRGGSSWSEPPCGWQETWLTRNPFHSCCSWTVELPRVWTCGLWGGLPFETSCHTGGRGRGARLCGFSRGSAGCSSCWTPCGRTCKCVSFLAFGSAGNLKQEKSWLWRPREVVGGCLEKGCLGRRLAWQGRSWCWCDGGQEQTEQ